MYSIINILITDLLYCYTPPIFGRTPMVLLAIVCIERLAFAKSLKDFNIG